MVGLLDGKSLEVLSAYLINSFCGVVDKVGFVGGDFRVVQRLYVAAVGLFHIHIVIVAESKSQRIEACAQVCTGGRYFYFYHIITSFQIVFL